MDAFLEKFRATRAAEKDQKVTDAFLEKIRATRAAVKDQEAKQLQVEASGTRVEEFIQAKLQEAPMRIPTTSGKAGALRELLRQSQAPPRVPMIPIASRTQAGQAAATKLSQGPASNTRSQANCALEQALHAASFLDKKCVSAKRLASRKFPPEIFEAAMAVMDIESREMLKH